MEALAFRAVLFVDDDVSTLNAFERSTKNCGILLFTASSGAVALRLAREHAPDLAIVDVRLGYEWGLDLVAPLKRLPSPPTVVVMTGYGGIKVAVAAIKCGADDFVLKPVTYKSIVRQLGASPIRADDETMSLDGAKREYAARVFEECGGNLSLAAQKLGVTRPTLRKLLEPLLEDPREFDES